VNKTNNIVLLFINNSKSFSENAGTYK